MGFSFGHGVRVGWFGHDVCGVVWSQWKVNGPSKVQQKVLGSRSETLKETKFLHGQLGFRFKPFRLRSVGASERRRSPFMGLFWSMCSILMSLGFFLGIQYISIYTYIYLYMWGHKNTPVIEY